MAEEIKYQVVASKAASVEEKPYHEIICKELEPPEWHKDIIREGDARKVLDISYSGPDDWEWEEGDLAANVKVSEDQVVSFYRPYAKDMVVIARDAFAQLSNHHKGERHEETVAYLACQLMLTVIDSDPKRRDMHNRQRPDEYKLTPEKYHERISNWRVLVNEEVNQVLAALVPPPAQK